MRIYWLSTINTATRSAFCLSTSFLDSTTNSASLSYGHHYSIQGPNGPGSSPAGRLRATNITSNPAAAFRTSAARLTAYVSKYLHARRVCHRPSRYPLYDSQCISSVHATPSTPVLGCGRRADGRATRLHAAVHVRGYKASTRLGEQYRGAEGGREYGGSCPPPQSVEQWELGPHWNVLS